MIMIIKNPESLRTCFFKNKYKYVVVFVINQTNLQAHNFKHRFMDYFIYQNQENETKIGSTENCHDMSSN